MNIDTSFFLNRYSQRSVVHMEGGGILVSLTSYSSQRISEIKYIQHDGDSLHTKPAHGDHRISTHPAV